jgi:hypothetical protein
MLLLRDTVVLLPVTLVLLHVAMLLLHVTMALLRVTMTCLNVAMTRLNVATLLLPVTMLLLPVTMLLLRVTLIVLRLKQRQCNQPWMIGICVSFARVAFLHRTLLQWRPSNVQHLRIRHFISGDRVSDCIEQANLIVFNPSEMAAIC